MIKTITASGRYTTVTGGNASTYVNGYSGAQGVGNMRYNTSSQNMEVFDGNSWITIAMDHIIVGLTSDTESLLDWVRSKQRQEIELLELASKNKAVQIALENVKKAQDQLTITAHLSREYETATS
jgi:hypothetical protein